MPLQHNPTWKPSFLLHLGFRFQLKHNNIYTTQTQRNTTQLNTTLLPKSEITRSLSPLDPFLLLSLLLLFFFQLAPLRKIKEKERYWEIERWGREREQHEEILSFLTRIQIQEREWERFLSVCVCSWEKEESVERERKETWEILRRERDGRWKWRGIKEIEQNKRRKEIRGKEIEELSI